MNASSWTEADSHKARQIWEDYQKQHDVSARLGQAVGIDPGTGDIWFGEPALDIVAQMEAKGAHRPLFFLRVGANHYQRKGKRS
jgi:hypothetical protein